MKSENTLALVEQEASENRRVRQINENSNFTFDQRLEVQEEIKNYKIKLFGMHEGILDNSLEKNIPDQKEPEYKWHSSVSNIVTVVVGLGNAIFAISILKSDPNTKAFWLQLFVVVGTSINLFFKIIEELKNKSNYKKSIASHKSKAHIKDMIKNDLKPEAALHN